MPRDHTYRAGGSIEDVCRACKTDRMHTIIVVDADGTPLRVACDYCRSEHNYRGGPTVNVNTPPAVSRTASRVGAAADPFPIVSEREKIGVAVGTASEDLELLLRRIIRE